MKNVVWFVIALSCARAQTLSSVSYGGSGNDTVNRIASDAAGNIYVAGTTTSFDLPLRNAWQSANPGTQIAYSTDAGLTWQAMVNVAPSSSSAGVSAIAVDPTNPQIVYAAAGASVYRSSDHGQHFVVSTIAVSSQQGTISGLAIDPVTPSTIYASVYVDGGVYKSTDSGAHWVKSSTGLPDNGFIGSISLDPFHPKTLWAWAGTGPYVSIDGAATWKLSSFPIPAGTTINGQGIGIVFDPAHVGTLYGPSIGPSGSIAVKSADGGTTWTALSLPFQGFGLVVDPVRSGYLYALASSNSPGSPLRFYRSINGGQSWDSFAYPGAYGNQLAVDPFDPNVLIAGSYRSTDDGETWSPSKISRSAQPVFAQSAKGILYASVPITSDAFVVKYQPDGTTVAFATYFGGMGAESVSGLKIDGSGNAWILGTTSSHDLPVTPGGFQSRMKGQANLFLAEFSQDGQLLYSSYLGSSGYDSAAALAITSSGNLWIAGTSSAGDYPVVPGQPPTNANRQSYYNYPVISELDSTGQTLLFSSYFGGSGPDQPSSLAVDPSDNVLVTGTAFSPDFPVSPGTIHSAAVPTLSIGKPFLMKFDSSAKVVFSTYLGGTQPVPQNLHVFGGTNIQETGVAVAADVSGNIYLAGRTSMTDFPTTIGAFQTVLNAGCTYPSSSIYTGLIGTLTYFNFDDVFVTKLNPDGTQLITSTLLGGNCYDRPTDMLVGPDGTIYIAGETNSGDLPLRFPVESAPLVGNYKSFVSVLNPAESRLRFSTYLTAGANPFLALTPDGILHVGGSSGILAQTSSYTGGIFGPMLPSTDGYVGTLDFTHSSPPLNLTRVLNAFSLNPGPVAPGEILTLVVPGLTPSQSIDIGLNGLTYLTDSLAGVSVYFDGRSVPIVSVAPDKITAIAPSTLAAGQNTTVQVTYAGAASNSLALEVAAGAVGMLSSDGSGTGPANARNDDGQLNSADHPAARGSYITLYFTGGGISLMNVYVNSWAADVAPLDGFIPGIYSARLLLPSDATLANKLGISLYSNGSTSQSLTIFVQ